MERIILFDGVCNLCNRSVQFILKRDPNEQFKFTSLQSETGQNLLRKHALKPDMKSVILIENDQIFLKSTAALRIAGRMKGLWKLAGVLYIIPRPIRDFIYQWVAKNRYKWFGKADSCMLPRPEWKNRFLE